MPTSQTIHQNIPIFSASKNPGTTPDVKAASNTFNQVLKNEVTSKAKKNISEQPKNTLAQSNKPNTTSNRPAKPAQDEDASKVKDANNDNNSETDQSTSINLNDPGLLLNFVNTLSTLTNTEPSPAIMDESNTDVVATIQSDNTAVALSETVPNITAEVLSQAGMSSVISNVHLTTSAEKQLDTAIAPTNLASQLIPTSDDQILPTNTSVTKIIQDPNSDSTKFTSDFNDFSTNTKVLTESNMKSANVAPPTLVPQGLQNNTSQLPTNLAQASPETRALGGIDSRLPSEQTGLVQTQQETISKINPSFNLAPESKKVINNNSDLNDTNAPEITIEATTTLPDNVKGNSQLDNLTETEKFSREFNAKLSQEGQKDIQTPKSEAMNESPITTDKVNMLAAAPAIIKPQDTNSTAIISDHINPRVGSKGWDQAIGQKIVWMVAGGEQSAQLTLNPPDLGPVQVVLSISDNFVDASFVSSHLDVREAIEAAAPKLREMMDSAGISLSGFSVSADSTQSGNAFSDAKSQQSASHREREVRASHEASTDSATLPTSANSRSQELGLVDTFA